MTALDRLAQGARRHGSGLKIACSFGLEDVVLLDLAAQIHPRPCVFVLDTGRLPQETYDVMERCRARYGYDFEVLFPANGPLEALLREKGPNSFYLSIENRKECCGLRKVEPLRRALADATAWVTGLRRAQAVTRAALDFEEIDADHGEIVKLNPLADWSEDDVWAHVRAHDVPYNALHDQGYPSIGCQPCTRAIAPGEDVRAGRWWWESPEHKECGLHVRQARANP
jgi:phosphoadenosine phosphosulfate reductase